jgi:hypothetical protein
MDPASRPASPACNAKLVAVTGLAMRGDAGAVEQLRLLGEALVQDGGVPGFLERQGAQHDAAVACRNPGSCRSAIGSLWGHIPEWAAP